MNRQTNIFIIILTLILLTACQNDCKVVKEKFENDKDKVVEYYSDCNDTTTFKRQTFYEKGQISSEGHVIKGVKNGQFKSWSEDGILTAEWEMIDGKEHGFIQCWYDNGDKKREAILNKGIKNGVCKDWYKDGDFIMRTYKNDTLWGNTYEYLVDSIKTVHVIGQYENGLETGLWKWFDKDSILYQTATLSNGEYTGEYIRYYKNGSVELKGYQINDQYEGNVTYYDDKGNVTKIINYRDGIKQSEKNYR